MGEQQDTSCEFCGGSCPESPRVPPDACTCRGCVAVPSSQTSQLGCGGGAAGAELRGSKMRDELPFQLPTAGEKKAAQHVECRCLELRQLCCGSYARYLQRRARLKESGSPRPLDTPKATGCNVVPAAATSQAILGEVPKNQMQHTIQRQQFILGDAGARSCKGASARDNDVFWVSGYGSLIWKTDGLPAEESVFGYIKGFKRVFFQLSEDHRGTRSSPGLVANLLPIEVYEDLMVEMSALLQAAQQESDLTTSCTILEERARDESFCGRMEPNNDEGIVHGVALRFSQADWEVVLEKLDYREKGGYSRVLVEFFPLEENEHQRVDPHRVQAFVYMGLPCNRSFYCFPDFPLSQNHGKCSNGSEKQALQKSLSGFRHPGPESTDYGKGTDLMYCGRSSTALLCHLCPDDSTHAAKMILRGKGVSGPNTEYLFRLADSLRSIGQVDEHVFGLEARLEQMMRQQVHHPSCTTEMTEPTILNLFGDKLDGRNTPHSAEFMWHRILWPSVRYRVG